MAALVETMFSVREKPWHGLGTIVSEAPDSQKALELAGLDWNVIQKDIITSDGSSVIPGFKANVRQCPWYCNRPLQSSSEQRSICIYR